MGTLMYVIGQCRLMTTLGSLNVGMVEEHLNGLMVV
jgi:hypothetical protein